MVGTALNWGEDESASRGKHLRGEAGQLDGNHKTVL